MDALDLYYSTARLLRAGELVLPGNWGSVIKGIGARHGSFFRETFLEAIRIAAQPDAVSRFEAAFAFEDREAAERFGAQDRKGETIYLVRASGARSRHDMAWLDVLANVHEPQVAEAAARAYWAGQTAPEPYVSRFESLSAGPLEVVERITKYLDDEWPPR